MSEKNQKKEETTTDTVRPITWKDARPQPRVRDQWDPAELANRLLDDMERGGRLVSRKRG